MKTDPAIFRRPILATLASLACLTAPALAQPHSVRDVASGDVLNIRDDVAYAEKVTDVPVVGTIPHDATDVQITGRTVEVNGATWREVVYGGATGWVNDRYLRPTNSLLQSPETLWCGGTEPFWTLFIDPEDSFFTTPEINPDADETIAMDYLRVEDGMGRTDLWAHYLASGEYDISLTAVVQYTGMCSDGMSDTYYDFDVFLLGMGGTGAPAHGCCWYQDLRP